ncbi:hypothetical protein D3C73_1311130 [compost metagenome]
MAAAVQVVNSCLGKCCCNLRIGCVLDFQYGILAVISPEVNSDRQLLHLHLQRISGNIILQKRIGRFIPRIRTITGIRTLGWQHSNITIAKLE